MLCTTRTYSMYVYNINVLNVHQFRIFQCDPTDQGNCFNGLIYELTAGHLYTYIYIYSFLVIRIASLSDHHTIHGCKYLMKHKNTAPVQK